ncbi:hypothetical protein N9D70_02195 [bacterium]|nr:hypothetical protein [bacterium]
MVWKKLGLLFDGSQAENWNHNYAALPVVSEINGNNVKVYFSSRDAKNVSSVFSLWLNINTLNVEYVSSEPVFAAGELGCFDDSGVMATSLIRIDDFEYMYYIGWNLGVTVPFRNSIGLARRKIGEEFFTRVYNGPILDRTPNEPHFCASCHVIKDLGIYRMWYLSCTGWSLMSDGKPRHNYHIKYAESNDAVNWTRSGKIALDFADKYEYAISVLRVIKFSDQDYQMWFSSRGTKLSEAYHIRHAVSKNGITWKRQDNTLGLKPSKFGWDSEMVEYPELFVYNTNLFMLYNGNGYGKSGFGMARLINR